MRGVLTMSRSLKNIWFLILLLFLGSLLGLLIGQALGSTFPILNYSKAMGFSPVTFNLIVIKLTFGFILNINIASILGFLVGLLIYSRL
ncbi:MAG: hypothetical protein XD50_1193 [Clostridia bacterium 41_269]|nr:MAG: hypothetical protein XD50_1193 [Clostridia bacterium 41_269]